MCIMAVIIVGLGNPGGEYAKTRHNAGRMAVQMLAKQEDFDDFKLKKTAQVLVSTGDIDGVKTILALPETMMNNSGKSMSSLVKSKKAVEKLVVLHDDLDLPIGTIKMTFGRGSGGHKGVESIMRAIKTKDFAQIKIGISSTTPSGKMKKPVGEEKVVKHVIGMFSAKEKLALKKSIKHAVEAVRIFVTDSLESAMQYANTKRR